MKSLFILCMVIAMPAFAECPAPADVSDDLEALFSAARTADNEGAGRAISGQMWELWLKAPDPAAQEVLDRGMRKREVYDFVGALSDFDRLAAYCPDYAEGFNQRAFVHFLRGDYALALVDLDKALELQPRHVGAQSGRALTLMNLDRIDEARAQLEDALKNNPWLSERFLLSDGGPLARQGKDI
ncbi:tetratricopeptide repeat protein [uncultured Roseobacter sp.]|uniref:tetratricopeptide repeat protein n=1 Tax=uncultured Roseobacter sp. TaxID=114847 RepID=UPI00262F28B8|nr:tetratricopeptide repeat protein [uncultured Roseobacter sp.]